MIQNPIYSDHGMTGHCRIGTVGKTVAFYGFVSLLLHSLILSGVVLGGTETGEFCPTCPDWTDIEGWQVQKVAYEKANPVGQLPASQVLLKVQGDNLTEPEIISNSTKIDVLPVRSGRFAEVLVSPSDVSASDIVLDISPDATRYIEDAININYEDFMAEGDLKPVSEISRILGEAGISSGDSIVITGECPPCGSGPSPAVFSYWLLKYLGHDNVRILDKGIEAWEAAGLNISEKPISRQKTNYTSVIRPELYATYDFVINSGSQIVDARPSRDFNMGSIPGAINIPYDAIIENERIKQESGLEKAFSSLNKDRPVVVYTNVGIEASLVWLALDLSGYDARLYSWRDWLENQPRFDMELAEVDVNPNPVRSGETTTITASFREMEPKPKIDSTTGKEMILKVAGCASCGFGSPQSFANLDRTSGAIQIGASGKAPRTATGAADGAMRCTAIINGQDGSEAGRTSLLHTSGDTYMGIWKASVAPGDYNVSISASVSGNAEVFKDVLNIEVTD